MKKNIKKIYFDDYRFKIFERIIFGIFMGFSDVIPGYSGGTSISILGFFEPFLKNIKTFFSHIGFKNRGKIFLWYLPFIISWILSIFLFSFISIKMINHNLDWVLIFLFISLSLFCIPSFLRANNINLKSNFDLKNRKNYQNYFYFILGFSLLLGISLGIYYTGGISLTNQYSQNIIAFSTNWILILLSLFFAGFCLLIPGISGSFILFLFGTYDEIYHILLHNIHNNLLLFALTIVFAISGIILSIIISGFLLKKFRNFFNNFCLGLILFVPISLIICYLGNSNNLESFKNIFNSFNLNSIYIFLGITFSLFLSVFIYMYLKNKQTRISFFGKNEILVIVDMQNDFSKKGAIPIKKFNSIAKKINMLINSTKDSDKINVVVSQDLHPINHFSFAKWGAHCVEHTYGSEISKFINLDKHNCFHVKKGFNKDVENFSIFTKEMSPLLKKFIKDNEIKKVYVVGVMSDVCVQETILDFKRMGIQVHCIKNLCSTNTKNFSFDSFLSKTEQCSY